jgi:hypothetical protein
MQHPSRSRYTVSNILRLTGAFAFAVATTAGAALAVTVGTPHTTHYTTEMGPRDSFSVPYTGTMELKYSSDGIINGTYRSTSVRPDPMSGRIVTVTGALMDNNRIRLSFAYGNYSFRGTVEKGGEIVASATDNRGKVVVFKAQPVAQKHATPAPTHEP